MNRNEFFAELKRRLSQLPTVESDKLISYYSELIDDRIDDGMTEADAIAALGSIDSIASQALLDASFSTIIKQKTQGRRKLRAWEIVLLAVGSPIWFSLLIAFLACFIAFYVAVWSVIFALWAADAAIALSGLFGIASAIVVLPTGIGNGIALIGCSLILIGLSVFFFLAVKKISILLVKLTALFARAVKKLIIGKGDTNEKIN